MTGPRLLVIHNDPTDPVGRLGEWLQGAGLHLEVREAHAGDPLPESVSGFRGLLVLGGACGVADDDRAPWLPRVRALLRDAVGTPLPTLGICLGAQLLAVAHGGVVAPNPGGPEYGAQLVAKRAATARDPLFGPLPITPDVIQWHRDAVTRLPAGAHLLASSPLCEVQAFRLGRLAWGVQFHIETSPQTVRRWAADDATQLHGYDVAALLARADAVHDDLAETWQPLAEAFAALVRDPASAPEPGGTPTTTAEPITDPAAIRAALAAEATAARGGALLPMPGLRPQGHD